MSRTLNVLSTILIIILVLAALVGLVWANIVYARSLPVEKDFLVPWLGARTFLQYGNSPYDDPASQRAQIVYYGRLATQGQDPLVLWLPFPVELLYFPFAMVPSYSLARAIWMTCLEIALVALGYFSLQLTGWKPGRVVLLIILLFPVLWIYGAFSIVSGSAAGIVALALVGFLLAIRSERDELAGGLMILMISAPRTCGVLVFFMFWWIIHERRWRILWGFLMGLVILLGLSFLLLPDWFLPSLRGLLLHYTYNPGFSSVKIFASWSPIAGLRLGWGFAAGVLVWLFFEWNNCLTRGYRAFIWTIGLTLSVTPLLGIPMVPMDYPYLIIPLVLFLTILEERRPFLKRWILSAVLLLVFLAGPWYPIFAMAKANETVALANILILLPPVFLGIALAWTRWWYVRTVPSGLHTPP